MPGLPAMTIVNFVFVSLSDAVNSNVPHRDLNVFVEMPVMPTHKINFATRLIGPFFQLGAHSHLSRSRNAQRHSWRQGSHGQRHGW